MNPAGSEIGPSELQALRSAGLVSARGYAAAVDAVRDEAFWARWGMRALLALGVGQFLAGVVFFFAYNWNDLSDIAKFAVIEVALAIAVGGALLVGLDRVFGQMLLIAASVLTGVLLAVIGQVYQTGADVFELFAVWAVLILPWTIISRHPVHWLLWLVVAEVALVLYCEQVLVPIERDAQRAGLGAGGRDHCRGARRPGTGPCIAAWRGWPAHWTRLVLLFAAMVALFAPAAGAGDRRRHLRRLGRCAWAHSCWRRSSRPRCTGACGLTLPAWSSSLASSTPSSSASDTA